MKKIFSILLVVAMIASLSCVSFAATANPAGGMHTVITETDSDITVTVSVSNTVNCNGITSYLITDKVTFVDGSAVAGDLFAGGIFTPTTDKAGYIKFVLGWTDTAKYITNAGSFVALTYKVAKVDPSYELSEADFTYGTNSVKASKVTTPAGDGTVAGIEAGNNFTTAKQLDYFTIEYVDARTKPDPTPTYKDLAEETFGDANDVGTSETDDTIAEGTIVKYGAGSVAMGANGKVHTFFAKATTGLDALSYGVNVTINEMNFKFPGKARVEAGQTWAIRFIVPDGTFNGSEIATFTMSKY